MLHGGLKRLVKWGLCRAATAVGADRLPDAGRPVILMYHRVLTPDEAARGHSSPHIVTLADSFAAQMAFLAARRRPMPLDELAGHLAEGRMPPPGTVAVTFDDGWEDTHRHALPVLTRHGIPATVFLTVDFVGARRVFFPERLRFLLGEAEKQGLWTSPRGRDLAGRAPAGMFGPGPGRDVERAVRAAWEADGTAREAWLADLDATLGRPEMDAAGHGFVTWDQVREMARAGVAPGSHGLSHARMTTLADDDLARELVLSRDRIAAETGLDVTALAYPKGDHDARVRAAARDAGYVTGCAVTRARLGPDADPLALPRVNVCEPRFKSPLGRFSPAMFQAALAGLF